MTLCVFVGVGAAFQPLRRIFPRQQAMGFRFRGSVRITSLVWRLTGSCHEDIGLPGAPLPQMLSPILCETLTFQRMTLPWTKCLIFLGSAGFPPRETRSPSRVFRAGVQRLVPSPCLGGGAAAAQGAADEASRRFSRRKTLASPTRFWLFKGRTNMLYPGALFYHHYNKWMFFGLLGGGLFVRVRTNMFYPAVQL